VKFPTGGEANASQARDPYENGILKKMLFHSGGSGVIPEPTVKVWMGEGESYGRVLFCLSNPLLSGFPTYGWEPPFASGIFV
jgi:hypothetical protein